MYLLRRAAARAVSAQPTRQPSILRPTTRVSSFQSTKPAFSRSFHHTRIWLAEEQEKKPEVSPAEAETASETVTEEPSKEDGTIKEESIATPDVADAAQQTSPSQPKHHHDAVSESSGTTSQPLGQSEAEPHSATEKAAEAVKEAQSTVSEKASEAAESAKQAVPEQAQDFVSNATQQAQSATSSAAQTVQDAVSSATRSSNPFDTANPGPPVEKSRILYIGNLFFEVTAPQLEAEMARFGEITNSRVVTDNRGLSKGFGYVQFATQEAADAAIAGMSQKVFQGRRMAVQYHKRRQDRASGREYTSKPPSNTLFIGNMSYQMSDRDLNDLFRSIRNVFDVRVAIDRRSGQPRGFAHAEFVDIDSAVQAKEVLEGKVVYGRNLRVDFAGESNNSRRNRTE